MLAVLGLIMSEIATASQIVDGMEQALGASPFDPRPTRDEWERLIMIVNAADALWCDLACGINDGEAEERLRIALGRENAP